MDAGLPLLNCLWQQALRSSCSSDSSSSSKWVYAVFWRILPRNHPPPRLDGRQAALDRSSSSKRNWMLVWEDGFCDFSECERAGGAFGSRMFCPEIFFKMSHEVYNYGEGLIGKVAAENSHKWVFREAPSKPDTSFFCSLNESVDSHPKPWELQFNSGIQTIAIVSVKEGVIQLGSLNKVAEDLSLVLSTQRKFNYLQSIPGVFALQRPYSAPSQHYTNTVRHNMKTSEMLKQGTRFSYEKEEEPPNKSRNLGWNSPRNNQSHLPPMSYSLRMLLSRLPGVNPTNKYVQYLNSVESGGIFAQSSFEGNEQKTDVKSSTFDLPRSKAKIVSPYSSDPRQDDSSMNLEFQMQARQQRDVARPIPN